jgi:acyl-CoA thioesterase-2
VDSFQDVIDLIQPEQVGRCWFRGQSPQPQGRIFGGQVLAQCLLAANATVEGPLLAHSMHAYFLRGGDPTTPIEFEVDPIRDGRSFATRRVVARQKGAAIFNTSISYQVTEDGFTHSQSMPKVPFPEEVDDSLKGFTYPSFSDMYQIDRVRITQRSSQPQEKQQNWFKVRGDLVSDARIHQAGLALISDCALLGTSFYLQGLEDNLVSRDSRYQ